MTRTNKGALAIAATIGIVAALGDASISHAGQSKPRSPSPNPPSEPFDNTKSPNGVTGKDIKEGLDKAEELAKKAEKTTRESLKEAETGVRKTVNDVGDKLGF